MFKRFAILLSFMLILSLLLVACGGDDEEATALSSSQDGVTRRSNRYTATPSTASPRLARR